LRKQNTIRKSAAFEGIGLHSGMPCRLVYHPAPAGTGIVFSVKHADGTSVEVPYRAEFVTDVVNNITVTNNGAFVKTVEHVAAALYGLHIDNCRIEVEGPEVPIMDGSSCEFVRGLLESGIEAQDADRDEFLVVKPVWVTNEDKFLVALPFNGFKLSYTISFPDTPVGTQTYQLEVTPDSFRNELSSARTFGFIEDLENYRKNGLVLGGGMENVQVFSKKEGCSINKPRFDEEPVRHKLLDLVGGLAILPFDIRGMVISYKGGHKMDILFAKKMLANIENGRDVRPGYDPKRDLNYYYSVADLLQVNDLPL
jgi:UDP-3-O-acyl N-acetylglucosamine deacetylase